MRMPVASSAEWSSTVQHLLPQNSRIVRIAPRPYRAIAVVRSRAEMTG